MARNVNNPHIVPLSFQELKSEIQFGFKEKIVLIIVQGLRVLLLSRKRGKRFGGFFSDRCMVKCLYFHLPHCTLVSTEKGAGAAQHAAKL
jgi:hypothetical protein